MTSKAQKLYEVLSALGSIEELGIIIDAIRDVFDVRHVAYLAISLGQRYAIRSSPGGGALAQNAGIWWRQEGKLAAGTYPTEWGVRYGEEDYAAIDPVIEGAVSNFMPFDWKSLDWSGSKRKRFFSEAVDCGLGNQGYTIPIRGPNGQLAVFVLNHVCSDDQWQRFIQENNPDLLIVSHFFHAKVLEIEKIFPEKNVVNLSAREKDVLRYIAIGKSRAQVADILQISENTLRVYLDSARHKLGALNVIHAATIAINRGLINVA